MAGFVSIEVFLWGTLAACWERISGVRGKCGWIGFEGLGNGRRERRVFAVGCSECLSESMIEMTLARMN